MSCGDNRCGELGVGDYYFRNKFARVRISKKISSILCYKGYTIIKLHNGVVMRSGYNTYNDAYDTYRSVVFIKVYEKYYRKYREE